MTEVKSVGDYVRVIEWGYEVVKARNSGNLEPPIPADFSEWERAEAVATLREIGVDKEGFWSLEPSYSEE